MGILEIVSGPFPFVDLLRIRNLPGAVFFLEHGISNVLFVADDIGNRRTVPDCFSVTGRDARFRKQVCDLIQSAAAQVQREDVPYNRCFWLRNF